MKDLGITTDLARLLQTFFCQRLIQQRNASRQTIYSYRDTLRLLLHYSEQYLGKAVAEMGLADINATLVLSFLDNLESQRHNCIRSRNNRLAAIRSFLRYAALQEPQALPTIQQVLAIPLKRFDRPMVRYLTSTEIQAIIDAPDIKTWNGMRDHALFATMYNTGARVSEIIAIRRGDFDSNRGQSVHLQGKGRKERVIPLWKSTTKVLKRWLTQIEPDTQRPIFPNRFGQRLSRSGVESRLGLALPNAIAQCQTLRGKIVSPHVIRHTTAMHLLQAGVDLSVIAMWLGHENLTTTHQYIEADLQMKEKALAKLQSPTLQSARYKPSNKILSFLEGL
jgi:site-specific recombinase XerD